MGVIDTLKYESKFKLAAAVSVVLVVLFLGFYNPYDQDYMQDVEKELILAKKICETSRGFVLQSADRLKLSDNTLDFIKVNGQPVKLEHVEYPRVLFFHTGFSHKGAGNELYCSFSDPRGTSKDYFYDYDTDSWVSQTRTRR